MAAHTLPCPVCGDPVEVPDVTDGGPFVCPGCLSAVTVPTAEPDPTPAQFPRLYRRHGAAPIESGPPLSRPATPDVPRLSRTSRVAAAACALGLVAFALLWAAVDANAPAYFEQPSRRLQGYSYLLLATLVWNFAAGTVATFSGLRDTFEARHPAGQLTLVLGLMALGLAGGFAILAALGVVAVTGRFYL